MGIMYSRLLDLHIISVPADRKGTSAVSQQAKAVGQLNQHKGCHQV